MAKRHKGNTRIKRKKKREKIVNDFFARERTLNYLISDFIKHYKRLSEPLSVSEYEDMNRQRLEIKRLFSLQESELYKQSYRRKRFYLKQLNRFKYHYVAWKKRTYYIYLHKRFDMPLRFIEPLKFYSNTECSINYVTFIM